MVIGSGARRADHRVLEGEEERLESSPAGWKEPGRCRSFARALSEAVEPAPTHFAPITFPSHPGPLTPPTIVLEDRDIESLDSAEAVDQCARRLFGRVPRATGLVHTTSVWRKDPSTFLTLRIGPETPESSHDTFVLGLARARADAILTTGRILRQEPDVTHGLPGSPTLADALEAWRRERLGKTRPPISLVLSRSGDIDLTHPLFRGPGRQLTYTSPKGAWKLESRAADAGIDLVIDPEPDPRRAVDMLRAELGTATISIEAGPTVARTFYEPPLMVDELMLSIFDGESIPTRARGLRQLTADRLDALFANRSEGVRVRSDDGPWEMIRWWRP